MGQLTLKGNQPIPQKPKSKMSVGSKVFVIILIVILLAPIVAAVIFYALITDKTHRDIVLKENETNQTIFNEIFVDALDDTANHKSIKLAIEEEDLNKMLKLAFKDKFGSSGVIQNFWVDANNGTYDFVFEIKALKNFITTTARMTTNLDIIKEADYDLLEFTVTDLKLGHIGGLLKFKDKLLTMIPVGDLEGAFADAGLSLKLDMQNLKLTYKSTDFYTDLINMVGVSGETDFIQIFLEVMAQRNLRTLFYEDKTIFGVDVPIDNLKISSETHQVAGLEVGDSAFVTENINEKVAQEIKGLLDAGKITPEDNLNAISAFIIGGYSVLTSAEKVVIDKVGPSIYGDEYKSHEPIYNYKLPTEKTIQYLVDTQTREQVEEDVYHMPAVVDTYLTTTDLDNMLRSSTTMGDTNYFVRNMGTDEEKNYKVNYVALDNLTTIIKGQSIYVALNVDFNGYSGQLTLKCTKLASLPTDPFGQLKLKIDSMYMGDYVVSENTQNAFMSTITGTFDDQYFSVNNGVISFNISDRMEYNDVLSSVYDMSFVLTNNTATEPGVIDIHAVRKF